MRVFLSLLLLTSIVLSCSKNSKTQFLQEQDIALVAPRITASSNIIDSTVVVTADLRDEDVDIFYTHDGTTPTKISLKYTAPLHLEKAGVYKFKAFRDHWKSSDIASLKLYKKGQAPSHIHWIYGANSTYPGVGTSTLINQEKASRSFRDPQWTGFDSIARSEISFKNNTYIKNMTVGYLIDTKSWIFPPKDITLYINNTDTIHVNVDVLLKTDFLGMKDFIVAIDKEVNTLQVKLNTTELPDWHPGKGNKAWLFMDEWIFN